MKIKNRAIVALGIIFGFGLLANFTIAQTLVKAQPEEVGMSSERLKRIDHVIQDFVQQEKVPGVIAYVARHGKIVLNKGYGYDDIATKSPLKNDAIIRIASQTKAITSTAVLMLYEEGKILLDDPISKYISTFKNPQVIEKFNPEDTTYTTKPAKREITIRDLLTHSSGVDYAVIGSPEARAVYAKHNIPVGLETPHANMVESITKLGKLPLFHEPGEKFTYGLNTDILGALVEVVSGKSLGQFFEERIFKPLGMNDTYFYLPENKKNRLSWLYTQDSDGKLVKTAEYNGSTLAKDGKGLQAYPTIAGTYHSGGAGLSSTAHDYAIFLQMILNGGKYNNQQLLSPTTVRMMTKNQLAHINANFGLGFGTLSARNTVRSPSTESTFDWGGAFGTTYWVDPGEGLVVVLITQLQPSTHGGDLSSKFRATIYQSIIKSDQKLFK